MSADVLRLVPKTSRQALTVEQQQQWVLTELQHRVKNILAVVSAVVQQTAEDCDSVNDFVDVFSDRLLAFASSNATLTQAHWKPTEFRELAEKVLSSFSAFANVRISGPDLLLQPRQLFALKRILHELLANALKYGALSIPSGSIALTWSCRDHGGSSRATIRWREEGLTDVEQPKCLGFGSDLLEACISRELEGVSIKQWHPDGLELLIDFPLTAGFD